ncbi:methyltransferase domain-containing protein [Phytomonospora sp. NPDC050363]|uniref:methyltransferase domain-containing protein n=1 Tax=Phytomonospora sp. NPDC050363 TaxID=3155642 RepID=UPI0033DFA44D
MSTEALIRLLDRSDNLPGAAALRARTYELLRTGPGSRVADVGCGTGLAVAELASSGAEAVGVDSDPGMVAEAVSRRPGADIREAGAEALPFADGELAGYRADKVFHEIPDPAGALREAHRVLAPCGRIVLVGHDWASLIVESADPELTARIVLARAETVTSPRVARAYRNLLLDGGFTDVAVEVHTGVLTGPAMLPMVTGLVSAARAAGAVSRDEETRWTLEQSRRARADRMFLAVPLFLAAATRS